MFSSTSSSKCARTASNGKPFTLVGLLLALALSLFSVNTSRAALMAYEGFLYTAGDSLTNASAQGNSGSFGWAGRWTGANLANATNLAQSLVYADPFGNILATNGGCVMIGTTNGYQANAQPSRSLAFGTLSGATYSGLSGGTYWVSFVMQWIGPVNVGTSIKYPRKGDLVFRTGAATNANSTGTALYSVGGPNSTSRTGTPNDTWATWSGNDATPLNTGLTATADKPLDTLTFVLIRIDLNGAVGNDNVYTWFNWTNLNVEPTIDTANLTNNSANEDGLNNIRMDANGFNATGTNTCLAFDEFRFGNTFTDVTPHTSAGASQVPTITAQPANTSATETYPATFALTVVGDPPLSYQWYYNTNTLITDATNTSYTIDAVQLGDAGTYDCVVANSGGSVTSILATLTVLTATPPSISAQPTDWTNGIGFTATFNVTVAGSTPMSYQWYYTDISNPLAGRTNSGINFIIASTNQAGAYFVIATNRFGSITSSVANLTVSFFGPSQLPTFPGADGAARAISGGRGGSVYHVTKLDQNYNDGTPGTLFYGLTHGSGPKTIVFDVAGVFWLGLSNSPAYDNAWDVRSRFNVSANTTVAGQTAPGPVIIMGGTVHCDNGNIIFRNVTIAPGYGMRTFDEPPNAPTPGDFPDTYAFDAMDIQGPNTMIDHVTTLFSTDESISANEMCRDLTIQNCNVSQAQNFPQLDAEAPGTYAGHALAHLVGAATGTKVSFINNYYAHMTGRLPQIGDPLGAGNYNDWRNCIIYNWSSGGNSSIGPSSNNIIGNFYLAGPGGYGPTSRSSSNITLKANGGSPFFSGGKSFVIGNVKDMDKNGSFADTSSADADISTTLLPSAMDINIGLTLPAPEALTNVFRHVGSQWWTRNYDFRINNAGAIATNNVGDITTFINERLIHEAVIGTGNWIAWADDPFNSDPSEGTEWRALLALRADQATGAAPLNRPANWDTDGDGMPDNWEIEHGLNPNDPSDGNTDYSGDGYSNLEKYLNELACWPAPRPVYFTGDKNRRYEEVFNWRVYGIQVNVTNYGSITTFSFWQPSRFDTAIITNGTVSVGSVGQYAGSLYLTNGATLNLTNGWLRVADTLQVAAGSTNLVKGGQLIVTNSLVNLGTMRLTGAGGLLVGGSFTNNGVLDIMTWSGTLPPGFVNNGTVLDRSLIHVDSSQTVGNDYQLNIQGYAGHGYQLQYRDDLSAGVWLNASTPVDGADAPLTLVHVNGATSQQRFYRVLVD